MRRFFDFQLKFDQTPIEKINFDLSSRDDLTKLLIGLQAIFKDRKILNQTSCVLDKLIPEDVDPNKGRRGMDLWQIFVLGCVRLCCDLDYDKLKEIADNHHRLRQLLGHSDIDFDIIYPLQTLKDNLMSFNEEVLKEINVIITQFGHKILGIENHPIHASCDSYVVETHVHFPTDINLLWDAMRVSITQVMRLCDDLSISGWRQAKSNLKRTKRLFLKAQRIKHSSSKDPVMKEKRKELIVAIHTVYLQMAKDLIERAKTDISTIITNSVVIDLRIQQINRFLAHAEHQIDLIERRVINGETIPHHEKVFSIFQEHTEWISKGKAGKPVELGLRVCIVKDQKGLILHHRVMQNETDDKAAIPMIEDTLDGFPNLDSCSFDKGFHSPGNQKRLAELLNRVYLPRKGKLSSKNKMLEQSSDFKNARCKHAAVESSISALENHGLDRCRDHGLHGFKRYVGLGVLARNIQIIGNVIQQKEFKKDQRRRKRIQIVMKATP